MKAWVRAGDWRGWPDDLEDQVTPVEVFLENGGADPRAVRPELFTLPTPGGFRAQATLERGGHVALLLLFPVAAARMEGFELAMAPQTPSGVARGALRVDLVRSR